MSTTTETTVIAPWSTEFFALAEGTTPIRESYFAPVWEDCGRCSGHGGMDYYLHRDGGVCYQCGGAKGKTLSPKTQVSRCRAARRSAREAVKVAAEAAESTAAREEWKAQNPETVAALATLTGSFAEDLRGSLEFRGSLTEKQAAAVLRIAAEKAASEPAPTGRVVITGKVISIKIVDSAYGSTKKMVVLDDRGFRTWGTVPVSLDEVDGELSTESLLVEGMRVSFTATVEPSKDDEHFSFFKRPTKAARI